jgi:UDP-2,4-diacetamido-2,4,6-trideoxy-beta-L-altropyranose hydrolase
VNAVGTLILRADASTEIGTGHVMRCLALADAWQAAGGKVLFLSHCPPRIADRVRRQGFELVALERPETAADDLARRLQNLSLVEKPAWVALDGYGFPAACQEVVARLGMRLLVVDDLAHLAHYHADVLLNPNLSAPAIEYSYDEGAALLLGPGYVLLRPEFRPWIGRTRQLRPVARNLLIVLGGSDPANVSGVALQAIASLADADLHTRVVVGPANPHLESLRRHAERLPGHVELVVDPADMPDLMAWADVAVSAAGTTCWELALMQLPTLAVVVADNQFHTAAALTEAGVIEHLGRAQDLTPPGLADAIRRLRADFDRRLRLACRGRELIDGRGAERVVAVMRGLDQPLPGDQVELRFARPDDLMPLLRLSNEPSVRRSSLNSEPITLEEHRQWFAQRLLNPDVRMWVLDYQGLVLGQIRYARQQDVAEISLAVAPAFRRRGMALRLLATRYDACEELRVERLRAVVRVENQASAETFRRAGFRYVDTRPVQNQPCHVFEWAGDRGKW